jgi:hypothetical protein
MDIDNAGISISGAKRNLLNDYSEDESAGHTGNGTLPTMETPPVIVGVDVENTDKTTTNKTKRTKKDGADSSSIGSTSSREELVRSQ